MTGAEALDAVQQAVSAVLDVDGVAPSADLQADLGADRLALLEIVEIVQARLAPAAPRGVRIEDEDLSALDSVGDAVDYAVARL